MSSAQYPSFNDKIFDLEKKIANNTALIADNGGGGGGGGVTSITGTTNQITASASTGAVALSLPATLIAPGSIQATTTASAAGFIGLASQNSTAAQFTVTETSIGNSSYLWRFNLTNQTDGMGVNTNGAPRGGPNFVFYDTQFSGSGSTFYDGTFGIGYNVSSGGGRLVNAEPSWFWAMEPDYWDGTKHNMETYWHYNAGSGSASAWAASHPLGARQIFIQMNRTTDQVNQFKLKTSTLALEDWNTDVDFGSISGTALALNGLAAQSVNTTVTIGALNTHGVDIKLNGAIGSSITGSSGDLTLISGDAGATNLIFKTTNTGTAVTALVLDNGQGATFTNNITLNGGITGLSTLTGKAGNMVIVAGTGNSRTLTLQTTTSGGAAATAAVFGSDQSTTLNGALVVNNGDATFNGSAFSILGGTILLLGPASSTGILKSNTSSNLELQTTTGSSSVLVRPGGSTVASFASTAQSVVGDFTISGTTTGFPLVVNPGGGNVANVKLVRTTATTSGNIGTLYSYQNTTLVAQFSAASDGHTDDAKFTWSLQPTGGGLTQYLSLSSLGVLAATKIITATTATASRRITQATNIATAAATTTLTTTSTGVQIFTGSTTQNVTLPAANLDGAGYGTQFIIKNRSSGTVTINRSGSDTIDGATSYSLLGGNSVTLISDSVSDWTVN